jgi:hypothetical protein
MEGRCVSIVNDPTLPADSPIVYCNSVSDRWEDILTHCNGLGCPKFRLVLISNMDWDVDLSPWAVEPVVSKKDRFNGGADKYLSWMLDKLLPYVNTFLTENGSGQPCPQILVRLFACWPFCLVFNVSHDGIFKDSFGLWVGLVPWL